MESRCSNLGAFVAQAVRSLTQVISHLLCVFSWTVRKNCVMLGAEFGWVLLEVHDVA